MTRPPAKGLALSPRSSVCSLLRTVLFPGPAPVSPTKQTRWGEWCTGSAESRQSAVGGSSSWLQPSRSYIVVIECILFDRVTPARRTSAMLWLISCRPSSSRTSLDKFSWMSPPSHLILKNCSSVAACSSHARPATSWATATAVAACGLRSKMQCHVYGADGLPHVCYCCAACSKTRGMGAGRKLQIHRRNQRWAGALVIHAVVGPAVAFAGAGAVAVQAGSTAAAHSCTQRTAMKTARVLD